MEKGGALIGFFDMFQEDSKVTVFALESCRTSAHQLSSTPYHRHSRYRELAKEGSRQERDVRSARYGTVVIQRDSRLRVAASLEGRKEGCVPTPGVVIQTNNDDHADVGYGS